MIVHHQTIVVATVRRKPSEIRCEDLSAFLTALVKEIKMNALFDPIAIQGKFGFTGIVGIVTSHIAFHYFEDGQILHFDVYSCKEYDLWALMTFLDKYWHIAEADVLFIKRDEGPDIQQYKFSENGLSQ
jgi:S-adenosylmethionine/arginine decarboxylase-like enzyme